MSAYDTRNIPGYERRTGVSHDQWEASPRAENRGPKETGGKDFGEEEERRGEDDDEESQVGPRATVGKRIPACLSACGAEAISVSLAAPALGTRYERSRTVDFA